ncbi:hypothetical protein T492DRAFT_338171 [Pavlovales sp. CCMP2436]|nr:hypothetical protein T492DRAFT_338171 [Pavlovales sp. CCMP2436]
MCARFPAPTRLEKRLWPSRRGPSQLGPGASPSRPCWGSRRARMTAPSSPRLTCSSSRWMASTSGWTPALASTRSSSRARSSWSLGSRRIRTRCPATCRRSPSPSSSPARSRSRPIWEVGARPGSKVPTRGVPRRVPRGYLPGEGEGPRLRPPGAQVRPGREGARGADKDARGQVQGGRGRAEPRAVQGKQPVADVRLLIGLRPPRAIFSSIHSRTTLLLKRSGSGVLSHLPGLKSCYTSNMCI